MLRIGGKGRARYRRRGISVIISSLLMVVAVGIIGAYLITWSNSTFAQQQAQIANQTASRINLIKETFVVEDVWFYNSAGQKADVTIRNSGDLAIKISKIYVNNTEVWTGSQVISKDTAAKVTGISVNWGTGKPQSIWIKTERGSEVKQIWKS